MVAGHAFVNHVPIGDGTSRRWHSLQAADSDAGAAFACASASDSFVCLPYKSESRKSMIDRNPSLSKLRSITVTFRVADIPRPIFLCTCHLALESTSYSICGVITVI